MMSELIDIDHFEINCPYCDYPNPIWDGKATVNIENTQVSWRPADSEQSHNCVDCDKEFKFRCHLEVQLSFI